MKDYNERLLLEFEGDKEIISNLKKCFNFSSGYYAEWYFLNDSEKEKWSIGVLIHKESAPAYKLRASAYDLCGCVGMTEIFKDYPCVQKVISNFIRSERKKYGINGDGSMTNLEKYM